MATWKSLGKVTVATAGTPTRITVNQTDPTKRLPCHAIIVQALHSNTGRVVVGDDITVNAGTYVHALGIAAIPTANVIPSVTASMANEPNGFNAADYYIDVTVNGEGAIVSVLEA